MKGKKEDFYAESVFVNKQKTAYEINEDIEATEARQDVEDAKEEEPEVQNQPLRAT